MKDTSSVTSALLHLLERPRTTLHLSHLVISIIYGVFFVLVLFWCLWPNRLWTLPLTELSYFCHMVNFLVNKLSQGETTYFVMDYIYSFFIN